MKNKIFFFSTFFSVLLASSAGMAQQSIIQQSITQSSTSISINEQGQSVQRQETDISLNLTSSQPNQQPYTLRISAPEGTNLTGEVTLDGKVVRELKGNRVEINLSELLTKGQRRVRISGKYNPKQSPVLVELVGPGTQISQQTSGYGTLDQNLDINVQ